METYVVLLISALQEAFKVDVTFIYPAILRTIVVSTLLLLIIRWLGNKGLGQLTTLDLIILLGLGEAVGSSMLYPDQASIPQGFTVIIIAIGLFKLYDYLMVRSKRFNKFIVPAPTLLLENGNLIYSSLKKVRVSQEEFSSQMRLNGIEKFSEIKLSYLEMNGQISFIKKKN